MKTVTITNQKDKKYFAIIVMARPGYDDTGYEAYFRNSFAGSFSTEYRAVDSMKRFANEYGINAKIKVLNHKREFCKHEEVCGKESCEPILCYNYKMKHMERTVMIESRFVDG
ncbi:MAG: hypothetical protein KAS32_06695 [Candidatus Peribacteraceae bacterium]|nr:hypothetical protein [Candidatus Peribacteraceae bacterium]